MTVYAYYRVSTDKQDFESQRFGVVQYAKCAGLTIDEEIVDDGVSGKVLAKDRKLGSLLKKVKTGDIVITPELSRLGRSTSDVINTCNYFINNGVSCYLVKQGTVLDNSPMGKMITTIFAAFAEMERDLIAQRTKEALAKKKAEGVILGRRFGSKNKKHKMDDLVDKYFALKKKGYQKIRICNMLKISVVTLNKWLKEEGLCEKEKQITN